MSIQHDQKRQPKGAPASVGGQWTKDDARAPSGIPAEPVRETRRGVYEVDDAQVEHDGPFARIHIGGIPERRLRNIAALATYPDRDVDARLEALVNRPVTILTANDAGSVEAQEGRPVEPGSAWRTDGLVLVSKGASRRGIALNRTRVLEVEAGYGHAVRLAARWRAHRELVPELEPCRPVLDAMPEDDDGASAEVTAVFVLEHPGFGGGRVPGCIYFGESVQRSDGAVEIINGYLLAPEGSELESEHGSFYARDFVAMAAAVRHYSPGSLSLREAMQLRQPDAMAFLAQNRGA